MTDDSNLLAQLALAFGIAGPTPIHDDENVLRLIDTFDEPVPAANMNPRGTGVISLDLAIGGIRIIGNLE